MAAVGQFTIADLNDITTSATAPSNPSLNMLWLDTSTNELKKYNGSSWEKATKYTDDSSLTSFIQNDYKTDKEILEEKIDVKAEIWFYNGQPTLSNEPVSSWDIEQYESHVGDLYYDTSTGYAYRFKLASGVYSWEQVKDQDTIEALALANSASDVADRKKQVFVDTPYPPYDNGDLWLNDGELYVCQISKDSTETFEETDFIEATKYTDDTLASQVGEQLEVVKGQVLTVKEGVDEFKISFDTTVKTINSLQQETTEALKTMSFSFGTKDLTIADSTDPVNARFNNQGVKVLSYTDLQLIANHLGVGANKLIVTGDSQMANIKIVKAIDENGNGCTDFHHLISNIQSLTDLEV